MVHKRRNWGLGTSDTITLAHTMSALGVLCAALLVLIPDFASAGPCTIESDNVAVDTNYAYASALSSKEVVGGKGHTIAFDESENAAYIAYKDGDDYMATVEFNPDGSISSATTNTASDLGESLACVAVSTNGGFAVRPESL